MKKFSARPASEMTKHEMTVLHVFAAVVQSKPNLSTQEQVEMAGLKTEALMGFMEFVDDSPEEDVG